MNVDPRNLFEIGGNVHPKEVELKSFLAELDEKYKDDFPQSENGTILKLTDCISIIPVSNTEVQIVPIKSNLLSDEMWGDIKEAIAKVSSPKAT